MKLVDVPFSYMWCLRFLSGKVKTVLDIGCGEGELMGVIARKSWKITGVDIYPDSLKKAKARKIYTKLIRGDIEKVCERLAKRKIKFDLVFCSQVIEHVAKIKGERLLDLSEKLAKKRIYFGTPKGYMDQPEVFLKNNPYQRHRSGWTINDFKKRGFVVYGVGFWPVWKQDGLARTTNRLLAAFWTGISYLFSPMTFYFPFLASGIMAVKKMDAKSKRNVIE